MLEMIPTCSATSLRELLHGFAVANIYDWVLLDEWSGHFAAKAQALGCCATCCRRRHVSACLLVLALYMQVTFRNAEASAKTVESSVKNVLTNVVVLLSALSAQVAHRTSK